MILHWAKVDALKEGYCIHYDIPVTEEGGYMEFHLPPTILNDSDVLGVKIYWRESEFKIMGNIFPIFRLPIQRDVAIGTMGELGL